MPRQGYTSVTMNKDIYKKIKDAMEQANKVAGFKKFRSMSHFIEYLVMNSERFQAIVKKPKREGNLL